MKALLTICFLGFYLMSFSQVKEFDFNGLEPLLHKETDSIYVINFWATWCSPCVAELPHFEKATSDFTHEPVKVLLVSLDFPKHVNSRLIPFISKNNLTSEVVLLNDPDANSWIDKVSPAWSGAIPATLIYDKNNRRFYEQSFTFAELEREINVFLNNRNQNN